MGKRVLSSVLLGVLFLTLSLAAEEKSNDCLNCFAKMVYPNTSKVKESNSNLTKEQKSLLNSDNTLKLYDLLYSSEKSTEDKILEENSLPISDYYCDNNKQPKVVDGQNDTYECV